MRIAVMSGKKLGEVEAELIGAFAIHRDIQFFTGGFMGLGRNWTLTHVASGLAIRIRLISAASARALAERLAGFDWDVTLEERGGRLWVSRVDEARLREAILIACGWPSGVEI